VCVCVCVCVVCVPSFLLEVVFNAKMGVSDSSSWLTGGWVSAASEALARAASPCRGGVPSATGAAPLAVEAAVRPVGEAVVDAGKGSVRGLRAKRGRSAPLAAPPPLLKPPNGSGRAETEELPAPAPPPPEAEAAGTTGAAAALARSGKSDALFGKAHPPKKKKRKQMRERRGEISRGQQREGKVKGTLWQRKAQEQQHKPTGKGQQQKGGNLHGAGAATSMTRQPLSPPWC